VLIPAGAPVLLWSPLGGYSLMTMPHHEAFGGQLLIFQIEFWVLQVIWVVTIVLKAYALFYAVRFSADFYPAADKLTKVLWCLILGAGLATAAVFFYAGGRPNGLLQLIFTTAALVFLCDVKPALSDLRR
jgi:Protein of unknown function (DUF2516)